MSDLKEYNFAVKSVKFLLSKLIMQGKYTRILKSLASLILQKFMYETRLVSASFVGTNPSHQFHNIGQQTDRAYEILRTLSLISIPSSLFM